MSWFLKSTFNIFAIIWQSAINFHFIYSFCVLFLVPLTKANLVFFLMLLTKDTILFFPSSRGRTLDFLFVSFFYCPLDLYYLNLMEKVFIHICFLPFEKAKLQQYPMVSLPLYLVAYQGFALRYPIVLYFVLNRPNANRRLQLLGCPAKKWLSFLLLVAGFSSYSYISSSSSSVFCDTRL